MYRKSVLPNGLRVLSSSMPHTHSVCVAIFIGVGSRYESDCDAGISHFIEHICFRGTPSHPTAREISEAIEGVGGILNGATDKEMTFYWCKVAKDHFASAASVLVDMLRNSKFKAADIKKERQVIIEEINMCKDSPSQQSGQLIDELLWHGHPLGRDIAGNRRSVTETTRRRLLDFLQERYIPNNTVVTVTGAVKHAEVVETVEKLLGSWLNGTTPPTYANYTAKPSPRVKVEKRETEQAHLCLAVPAVSLFHPERFPLDLLNVILGEGMSSRLFAEIRDKMGLAYSINSYVEHFLDTGSLTVAASVDPSNLNKAVSAILAQLKLLKSAIPESEMNKAREISKGRLLLRMEDSRNVAGWLGGQEMLTNRILTVDEMVKIIDDIKVEQLQSIATKLFLSEKLRLAVVGPVSDGRALEGILHF